MGKTQNCHATNSLPKVKQFCEGKTSCKVQSTNTHFGDPCGGTHKYLTVNYVCKGGKPSGDKNLSDGNSGSAKNLKACTGECDADSQCAKGLKCFQRSKGEVKKPKKVVAYQVPDKRGGCPGKLAANKALL